MRRPNGLTLEEAFAWYPKEQVGDCLLWCASRTNGYGDFRYEKNHYMAHHVAYRLANGDIPPGMDIDHRCRNRACVNSDHLRLATRKQNLENKGQLKNNTSGIKGVSWHKATQMWTARVMNNGHQYAAYFHDKDAAAAWVVAKRLEMFSHNEDDRMSLPA